jgi:hypothetical protein
MPDERGVLREIAWREIFPWVSIVRCARLALSPRLVALAALSLFATAIGWRSIGNLYPESSATYTWVQADAAWPWETQLASLPPLTFSGLNPVLSPVLETGRRLSAPFVRMFTPGITFWPFTYCLLCALWEVAVWALVAGAIVRIVAVSLARESRVGITQALKFAAMKWPQFFLAAVLPLLGVIALSFFVGIVFGLIMRADFGVLVMSFFWPLLLVAGLVMAILLLGLLFGWPLMWPTIAAEGTDSFDALSRSYSYTFQRPFHYLFYLIVAGVIGLLAAHVVAYFVVETNQLADWSASWGSRSERMQEIRAVPPVPPLPSAAVVPSTPPAAEESASWSLRTGRDILGFWTSCVLLLGTAYLYSYFWSAATAIYFLLRQSVDGTEPDEVAVEHEEETFGLPPLKTDASGVPQVVEKGDD